MIDILGLDITVAEEMLKKQGINYAITEYTAVKPLQNTDIKRVVRVIKQNDALSITICGFKGNTI